MLVVTNAGSNLSAELLSRWGIVLSRQQINVDGVLHETRDIQSLATIDAFVRSATKHPFVLGTSAPEFVSILRELAKQATDAIVVTTSRKLIGSYDAAIAATRTLTSMGAAGGLSVSIVDSHATDVATGLITLFCAVSAAAGKPRATVASEADRLAEAGAFVVAPAHADYLVKGGRASFLKSQDVDMTREVPVLSMVDGEITKAANIHRDNGLAAKIIDVVEQRLGGKRRVWAAVAHGGDERGAAELASHLRTRFDVAYVYTRALSPGIYLHFGPGALAIAAYPIDLLPWSLPMP